MKGAKALLPDHTQQDKFTSAYFQEHFTKKEEKRKNKYGAKPVVYKGVKYPSTKEGEFAQKLDFMVAGKVVHKWERQLLYKFVVNGVPITTYKLDFKVWYTDGRIEYIDVKGAKNTDAYKRFKVSKMLMLALFGIDVLER